MKQGIKGLAVRALASRPVSALMSPLLRNRASIFMLHRFRHPASELNGIHDPKVLRACLEELRRARVPVISLDAVVTRAIRGEPMAPGTVVFTMDDGFWDQGEIGAELFLEFDIPVTIFLITGLQDGTLWPWDDRLAYVFEQTRRAELRLDIAGHQLHQRIPGKADDRRQLMRQVRAIFKTLPYEELEAALDAVAERAEVQIPASPPEMHRPIGWDSARALERRGVRFGPHTVSHGIVSRMTDAKAREELLGAWTRIRAELKRPVDIYGWPTGRYPDFGPRDIDIVREAGFRAAVATEDDYAVFPHNAADDAMFSLHRFGLPGTMAEFVRYRSWLQRGKQVLSFSPA